MPGSRVLGDFLRQVALTSPFGPLREWPHALRFTVQVVLCNPLPMVVWWGPRFMAVGNTPFWGLIGERAAFGGLASEVMPRLWPSLEQPVGSVLRDGQVLTFPVVFPTGEERSLSCMPIYDAGAAAVQGVLGTWIPVPSAAEVEHRLRLATTVAGLGVFAYDLRNDVASWENDRMYEIFGRTREQGPLRPSEFRGLMEPEALPWQEGDAPRGDIHLTARLRRPPDDGARWIEVTGRFERVEDGEPERMVGVVSDITERVRAARTLELAKNRLQLAFEGARIATFAFDLQTRLVTPDPALSALFNLPEDAHPRPIEVYLNQIHVDDRPHVVAGVEEAIRTAGEYEMEYRIVSFEPPRWVLARARVVAEAGQVAGAVVDITDRKRAQHQLDSFFELSPDLLAIASVAEKRWNRVNSAMVRTLGWDADELLATPILELVHPEDVEEMEQALAASAARGLGTAHTYSCDVRVRCGDGGYRWITWSMVPADEDGLLFCAGHDATDRRRTFDELRDADRRKTEFLGVLSHELRNPLAPIKHGLTLLDRAQPGSDTARRAREVLERQVGQVERLVDDLLDVTRVTRGKLELRTHRLALCELVSRLVEDHRPTFDAANVALEVALEDTPLMVRGDPQRLAQVVGNLLHNAAKFTPRGGKVQVSVRLTADWATLTVSDNGVGIPLELADRLFEPFVQASQTLERSRGGLGLGLALVRGLVELHGGRVRVMSAGPGQGSTFTVELPTEQASRRAVLRVVVIGEDTESAWLTEDGHSCRVARSGPDGLAEVLAWRPDVVLCDLDLPGMSGEAVAQAIRADRSFDEVVLIAFGPERDDRAIHAGFDACVAKPPDRTKLRNFMARRRR